MIIIFVFLILCIELFSAYTEVRCLAFVKEIRDKKVVKNETCDKTL